VSGHMESYCIVCLNCLRGIR